MAKKSKKSISGFLIFLIICLATAGLIYGAKHAFGEVVNPNPDIDVVDPTPDVDPNPDVEPEPGTELACVFDRDWFEQISGMAIEVPDNSTGATKTETITKESINHISFGKTSTGTYLGKTTSGIDVYYTRSEDGKYSLDFVSDKTISAPTNCDNLFSGCSSLTGMDFSNFDTTPATSSNDMFSGCNSFNSVTGSSNYGLGNLPSSTTGKSDMNETIASETATNLGINQNNISKISFLQASDKTYLTTLNSGIVTYYSQDEDGNFELDFVAHKIYAPENCLYLFSWIDLKSIDFTNFDTSNVTNMSHMFECCTLLESLDLSGFDTSNVTDMSNMFYECMNLIDLDLSNFNTSNVTNMSCMFGCCNKIPYLDLSSFDTRNVTSYDYMFSGDNLLYTVITGENYTLDNLSFRVEFFAQNELFNTQTVQLNHNASFVEAPSLEGYYFVGWRDVNTNKIYDPFNDCTIWSNTTFMAVYEINGTLDINQLFNNSSVIGLNINKEMTTNSISFLQSSDKTYLTTLNCGIAVYYTESNGFYELDLVADKIYAPTDSSRLFGGFTNLVSLDFSNFDTSNVTNMSYMFYNCESLETLNLSSFHTENLYDMSKMFQGCTSLESLDLSGFDTSNVTDMSNMFYRCRALSSLNISNFDTSNVTDMSGMFQECAVITELDLSHFNTSNVTNMRNMFRADKKLANVILTSFDTNNVIYMTYMFYNCESLETLNLSSFHTENLYDMSKMFQGCTSLTALDLSNFDTRHFTTSQQRVFSKCGALTITATENFRITPPDGSTIIAPTADVTES